MPCLWRFLRLYPLRASVRLRMLWGRRQLCSSHIEGVAACLWRGFAIHSLFYNSLFGGKAPQERVGLTQLVFLWGPLPKKGLARLCTHTPCPPRLDWFSVCILEGITAICGYLRNKGGSTLFSLRYFRATWQLNMSLHCSTLVHYSTLTSQPIRTAHFQFIADRIALSPLLFSLLLSTTLRTERVRNWQ